MDPQQRIHVYESVPALSLAAATAFAASAREALSQRERFTVALSGGSTPKTLYTLLASEFRNLEWDRIHFFWVDERFVSADDEQSNYRMADETLLRPLALPVENIHTPDTGTSDASGSAQRYQDDICTFFEDPVPSFDWILLGMGEDGHIGSLFPGSPALEETERLVIAVDDSPKPPPVRLTMTLPLLNAAREVHFLVAGWHKRNAFTKILTHNDTRLPAQQIHPSAGTVDWWVELAATPRPAGPPSTLTEPSA